MFEVNEVVDSLTKCITVFGIRDCSECRYNNYDSNYCQENLMRDALELLKAQEPQTVIVDDIPKDDTWFGIWFGRCPNCKEMLTKKYHKHFCGNCGQAVKWNE